MIRSFEPPLPAASGLLKSCVRALVRQSRRVLVTSVAARKAFLRIGVCASKIVVWRPGVEASMFAPSKRSAALRERWGVSDARPAVIYAGAMSDDRGARRLLSLELALRRTRPMHQLIVAGDGPSRNEVQARCPNAIFMGAVPRHRDAGGARVRRSLRVSERSSLHESCGARGAGVGSACRRDGKRKRARTRGSNRRRVVCRSHADFIVETAGIVRTDARRKAMGIAAREYAMRQEWDEGLTRGVRRIPRRGGGVTRSARSRASLHFAEPTLLTRTAPSWLQRGASRESCSSAWRGHPARGQPSRRRHCARS